jgi:hypothetical protein
MRDKDLRKASENRICNTKNAKKFATKTLGEKTF